MDRLERHGFLKGFYENPYRYSEEFEWMHHILLNAGLDPDPVIWGRVFSNLVNYHQADAHNSAEPFPIPQANQTWGARRQSAYESLLALLTWTRLPGGKVEYLLSEEISGIIRDQLIHDIPNEAFLSVGLFEHFAFNSGYVRDLKPGDPLLIK